jgi:hypothetical protein
MWFAEVEAKMSGEGLVAKPVIASTFDGFGFVTPDAVHELEFDEAFRQFVLGRPEFARLLVPLLRRVPNVHERLRLLCGVWPIKFTANNITDLLPHPPLSASDREILVILEKRWRILIEWLRRGDLVAIDIDGNDVPRGFWRRPDALIDLEKGKGDLYLNYGRELFRRGVTLRVAQPEIVATPMKEENASMERANSAAPIATSWSRRSRGPKSKVGLRVREEMRHDLDRSLTVEALGEMHEKEMATKYRASRDTCRKAREAVMSEFRARQITTNDN